MAFPSYLYSFLHTFHCTDCDCDDMQGPVDARVCTGTLVTAPVRSWGEPPALQLLSATARLKRRILSIFFLISNGCCEAYWANVCKLLGNSPMNCALGMLSIAPRGLFLTWSVRDELFLYRELTSSQKNGPLSTLSLNINWNWYLFNYLVKRTHAWWN